MRVKLLLACVVSLCALSQSGHAQSIEPKAVYGHELWRDAGEERRRVLYEIATGLAFAQRAFHFTSEDLLGIDGALWSEADVQLDSTSSGRIVTEVGLADGKYAAEYYFDEGETVLVYETRYFTAAAAPRPISENFKGIAAWERLTILSDDMIVYAHSGGRGAPTPGTGGDTIVANGANLLRRVSPEIRH